MPLERIRSVARGGLTLHRLWRALIRRARALPDDVIYGIRAGPGTANWNRIEGYRDLHLGERCFVIGNGPSLSRTDPSRIGSDCTFGLNRIYLKFTESEFRPAYYVCMNRLVIEQTWHSIAALDIPKFLNWGKRNLFSRGHDDIVFLRESFRSHFSTDLTHGIWGGATVTFAALQVAYHMGFQQVVLIGVDHKYSISGPPHTKVMATGPDLDHFHPDYFTDGFEWHLPDLATSELAYRIAKREFEADGREIVNATAGGNLEIFRRVEFNSLVE